LVKIKQADVCPPVLFVDIDQYTEYDKKMRIERKVYKKRRMFI